MYNLTALKKRALKELQTHIIKELKRRYHDHRPPKYGNLNKTFTNEQELAFFLHHVTNERAKLIFQLQAYLGLRVSEACKLRTNDLDLMQRRVWIRSVKDSVPTSMYLHDRIYHPLKKYYQRHHHQQEYLFPTQPRGQQSNHPHISPDWIRNEFRLARGRAQLNYAYAESEESCPHRPARQLQKLTTHSLRRYFIQHVHKQTGDVMMTQKLARHRSVKNTLIYLHANQAQLDAVLITGFRGRSKEEGGVAARPRPYIVPFSETA